MPFQIFMGDDAERHIQAMANGESVRAELAEREARAAKRLAELTARETQIGDRADEIQEAAKSIVRLARHVRRLFVLAIASPVVVEALIHLPGWLRHA